MARFTPRTTERERCALHGVPLGACLFLSLFAVCRRFSLQPSCHPAVFLLSHRSPSRRFFLCRSTLLCLVLQRHCCLSVPCSRGFSCLSAQFRSPRCVLWPLKFIQLTSRQNDSSDAHSDHLPPRQVVTQVHSFPRPTGKDFNEFIFFFSFRRFEESCYLLHSKGRRGYLLPR